MSNLSGSVPSLFVKASLTRLNICPCLMTSLYESNLLFFARMTEIARSTCEMYDTVFIIVVCLRVQRYAMFFNPQSAPLLLTKV